MKINSIINRYLFKELAPPFLINTAFFTFIFLMAQMLDITNFIVNYNMSIFTVVLMIACSVPYFLVFVIPMSVMISVLLTFLRLSSDNEITALRSLGVRIYNIMPPVLAFCLIGCVLTFFTAAYGLPWGRLAYKKMVYQVKRTSADIGLKERTFVDGFKDVMLYINKIDIKSGLLVDVFIEDQRTEDIVSTIVAQRGRLSGNPENFTWHLKLYNGAINRVDLKSRSVNSIDFDTYDIILDIKKPDSSLRKIRKDAKAMSLSELLAHISSSKKKDTKFYSALMELHRKFSIPFACFALGILAVPLGIQSKHAKRSFGLVTGLVFFLLYYLMLSAGLVFGETGTCPPALGMWLPNIVMGTIGLYLLFKTEGQQTYLIKLLPGFVKRFFLKQIT